MTVYRSLAEIPHNPLSVLTIGTFDGVHRGHQQVIGALTQAAKERGGRSVVITFDPHPQEVIRRHGTTVDILTTIEERQEQFRRLGVDAVVVIPFTREFAATPWEEFVEQLESQIGIAHMIVGHDHAFGKDRKGNAESLQRIIDARPDILNHNTETVPSLYRKVRPQGRYQWTLDLLQEAKRQGMKTKTGIMLGLGEQRDELLQTMRDLAERNVDILTLGQYLQPTKKHLPVERFVTPEEFDEFRIMGLNMGFRYVESGPLVRSSYHAERHI